MFRPHFEFSGTKFYATVYRAAKLDNESKRYCDMVQTEQHSKATQKETKLIQEVPTRWNSTYHMIERFLELRTIVNDIIIRYKNAPPMLTASELSILSLLIQVLRPIEAATKEVSAGKYCTSSKVIPLIHCLLLKIKPLKLEESLAKELQSPRYWIRDLKKMHFTDPIACSSAVAKVKKFMKATIQNEVVESDSSDHSDKPEDNFSLWDDHHKLVHKSWKTAKSDDAISDELSIYLRSPFLEHPLTHKRADNDSAVVGVIGNQRLWFVWSVRG
ncbi:hypothetical protein ILUMI_01664 [Ignelater luminosus]|uniref:Uncharacterized protein n=1 Tax=Ignelater luminosus TaxID=2038154 RepID=A0A8K0DE49_IGNLU|nr:hypothetical protein ILUMI_01664 [Ignelater luminosus]